MPSLVPFTSRSYDSSIGARLLAAAAVAVLAAVAAAAPLAGGADKGRAWPPEPYPGRAALRDAREFAAAAPGTVAFAVIDADRGSRGLDPTRSFSSASVSKALLLAGALRRRRDQGLDAGTRSLLESMIRYSDNDAASSVYAGVGDGGMTEAAERTGMRDFEAIPGYWGGAQVTAADLARFFFRLERALPRRHRRFGERLLATIVSTQRWGIPAAAPGRWRVYFKGGWRPPETTETSGPVTHQAALLRDRSGRRLGLAILTDLSPGGTAYEVLEGITRRLLDDPPPESRWVAP